MNRERPTIRLGPPSKNKNVQHELRALVKKWVTLTEDDAFMRESTPQEAFTVCIADAVELLKKRE